MLVLNINCNGAVELHGKPCIKSAKQDIWESISMQTAAPGKGYKSKLMIGEVKHKLVCIVYIAIVSRSAFSEQAYKPN